MLITHGRASFAGSLLIDLNICDFTAVNDCVSKEVSWDAFLILSLSWDLECAAVEQYHLLWGLENKYDVWNSL